MDGMEITQFTYFQQVGGLPCDPVMGEITYGLERLALYLQGAEDFQSLIWSQHDDQVVTYADVFHQYEVEMSAFNFDEADIDGLQNQFDFFYPLIFLCLFYFFLPRIPLILKSLTLLLYFCVEIFHLAD